MAVRFETGAPVTLIFPFGDFREVQGQHGLQYLYTVQLNGDPREKLYATPALHRELQAAGMAPGTLFTITKLDGTGNRYWRVENGAPAAGAGNGQAHQPAQAAVNTPPAEHPPTNGRAATPAPTGRPATGAATNGALDDFTVLEQLLGHCLAASSRVCGHFNGQVQFTSEDIRRLGTTLFLECSRKHVLPEPLQR